MSMGNFLRVGRQLLGVMATTQPTPGMDHPTVVPENAAVDDDEGSPTDEGDADGGVNPHY
jgi:hypothetical protein